MRLSVEPLCQTHNVQGRREPVYNSGNPHRKNKDGYFPAGKLLFHASFTLLKSFCQARSIECFPSSHVFSSKSKLLLSCTKSLQTFSAFFFLSHDPFKTECEHKQETGDSGCNNQLYLWFEATGQSFHLPKGRTLRCRGQRHSICLCTLKTGGREHESKNSVLFSQVLEWLLQ